MSIDVSELRQRLAETRNTLAELEAAAIDAVIGGKSERDLTAIETRKAQARERIVLLGDAIKHMERQLQLDAQEFMTRETMAVMAPLVAPLDEAAAKFALPPHTGPMHDLTPETIPAKKTGRWFGNRQEKQGRWNER